MNRVPRNDLGRDFFASAVVLVVLLLASPVGELRAEVIDRIAAIVNEEAITTSEIDQLAIIRFHERNAGESEEEYRRRLLSSMIAQMLRYRDVIRFGAIDVGVDEVEARVALIAARFPSEEAFEEALRTAEVSPEQLRALVRRQMQVEAYIEERFSPMIFVSLEEIERYYRDVWVEQRLDRGLPLLPLGSVREEIRGILKSEQLQGEIERWTRELRERASVDVYL